MLRHMNTIDVSRDLTKSDVTEQSVLFKIHPFFKKNSWKYTQIFAKEHIYFGRITMKIVKF